MEAVRVLGRAIDNKQFDDPTVKSTLERYDFLSKAYEKVSEPASPQKMSGTMTPPERGSPGNSPRRD